MEKQLKVTVLEHTPNFERNIARAGKLCYSPSEIEELNDKLTDEDVKKYLDMILGIGHGSILEHSTITFGIEGISRSLSHQLVRHRVGTNFSQKSQRYVNESDFGYVVPVEIKQNNYANYEFEKAMDMIKVAYNNIANELEKEYCKTMTPHQAKKKAYENARAVLPNATETKMVVTMNVRSLFHFFKERLCERSQDEIRAMALEMWKECMKISPTIFKYAVPTCVNGKCKEGKMTCGKVVEVRNKFNSEIIKRNK